MNPAHIKEQLEAQAAQLVRVRDAEAAQRTIDEAITEQQKQIRDDDEVEAIRINEERRLRTVLGGVLTPLPLTKAQSIEERINPHIRPSDTAIVLAVAERFHASTTEAREWLDDFGNEQEAA